MAVYCAVGAIRWWWRVSRWLCFCCEDKKITTRRTGVVATWKTMFEIWIYVLFSVNHTACTDVALCVVGFLWRRYRDALRTAWVDKLEVARFVDRCHDAHVAYVAFWGARAREEHQVASLQVAAVFDLRVSAECWILWTRWARKRDVLFWEDECGEARAVKTWFRTHVSWTVRRTEVFHRTFNNLSAADAVGLASSALSLVFSRFYFRTSQS